jgi:hypothetical protein
MWLCVLIASATANPILWLRPKNSASSHQHQHQVGGEEQDVFMAFCRAVANDPKQKAHLNDYSSPEEILELAEGLEFLV